MGKPLSFGTYEEAQAYIAQRMYDLGRAARPFELHGQVSDKERKAARAAYSRGQADRKKAAHEAISRRNG